MWRRSKNKLGNTRVNYDGYSFQSKLEAAVYQQLKLELKAGLWTEIKCQDRIKLSQSKTIYIPDFRVKAGEGMTQQGEYHWVEAKGHETAEWRIKYHLWEYYGPGPLRIYKGDYHRFKLVEVVIPKGVRECLHESCPIQSTFTSVNS